MTLHQTRNPNDRRFLTKQFSRVDWGSVRDLKSSFTSSFSGGGWGGHGRGSGDAKAGGGGGMAAAAAAVASSYGEGISDGHLDGSASDRYGPSRYDPTTMDRIVDMNDLHEEGSDISNVSDLGGNSESQRKRRAKLVVGTISIIVAASVAIGVLMGNNNSFGALTSKNNPGRGSNANLQVGYNLPEQQQPLLNIAQHVLLACSEEQLNKDLSDCQSVCHNKLCCFESKGSKYDCREDEEMKCPVYAGCEALVMGSSEDVASTSTGTRVRWG